jgi:multimeric flavodoxin WrbA
MKKWCSIVKSDEVRKGRRAMNIVVLNGSPKGEVSITMQYISFLQKHFPDHSFRILHISQEISTIEKSTFQSVIEEIEKTDALIWASPLYVFLVPSQLKRFIELIYERKATKAFENKYATALTTSAHFFDHTAHAYLRGISEDLSMSFVTGISFEMEDLLNPTMRDNLVSFGQDFFRFVERKLPTERRFAPVPADVSEFTPPDVPEKEKTSSRKIVLVTDGTKEDINLNRMIEVFTRSIPNRVTILNINEMDIRGGCLGCCMCAEDNKCVYKDGYTKIFNEHFPGADCIIHAATIKDRFLSWRFKMFMDRSFFNGHRPIFMGKQIAFILSGPLRHLPGLMDVLQAEAEVGRTNLVGIVTDEYRESKYVVSMLENLGERILRGIEESHMKPPTFLGVGGHLIFRDLVYTIGTFFKSDYRFYRDYDLFDYPHKNLKNRLKNSLFACMLAIPSIRREAYRQAKHKMIESLQKVLKDE